MIRFEQLSLRRGAKLLVERASLQIAPGEHVGLVGANGSGKSSLFALLRGELHADSGELAMPPTWRIAHVAQHAPHGDRPAVEFVIDGDRELRALEAALAQAEDRHDGHAAGELHARLADHDAYTARSRAESLLLGLGFRTGELEQPVSSFSGGWRMRLALAQVLMQPSDLLLLDEPTNHLDLDAVIWLEDWLARYPGTLLVISHDRDFLDAVARTTLHIERGALRRYGGNYSTFERERTIQIAVQQAAWARQQQRVAHLESFIARFKAKASKARQAQSRVKALERMTRVAPVEVDGNPEFGFLEPAASPDPMLRLEEVDCGYRHEDGTTARVVVHGVSLTLRPGQRVGVLGANGQGKTTLVRTLAGDLPALSGETVPGRGLAVGYFAQHEIERLRGGDTPLEALTRLARSIGAPTRESELRAFLGRFDFSGDMAVSPIAPFSGGEKARLALALIVFQRPNLLVLDEPTNHLDLQMREALSLALAGFEGTLVLVSHDRHLLRSTVDELVLVADGQMRPWDGDLDEYRSWLADRARAAQAATRAAAARAAAPRPAADAGPDGTFATGTHGTAPPATSDAAARAVGVERPALPIPTPVARMADATAPAPAAPRRTSNRESVRLEREIAKLEKAIETLGAEKAALDATLADTALYAPARRADLDRHSARHAQVCAELEAAEAGWLEKSEALAALA